MLINCLLKLAEIQDLCIVGFLIVQKHFHFQAVEYIVGDCSEILIYGIKNSLILTFLILQLLFLNFSLVLYFTSFIKQQWPLKIYQHKKSQNYLFLFYLKVVNIN